MLFTDEGDGDDDGRSSARSVPILKTKNGIVLSPQPHDDPNDPLVPSLPRRPRFLLPLLCALSGGDVDAVELE
jgi:hypothetical protein